VAEIVDMGMTLAEEVWAESPPTR